MTRACFVPRSFVRALVVAALVVASSSPARAGSAPGSSCTAASDCDSSVCVDHVCCSTSCDGPCISCASARTGEPDGQCAPLAKGVVSAGCVPDGDECGLTNQCDGLGNCAFVAPGTGCAALGECSGNDWVVHECNGSGSCVAEVGYDCAPYVCSAQGGCRGYCGPDVPCAPGAVCVDSECFALPHPCNDDGDCGGGVCNGGTCCAAGCEGPCVSCFGELTGEADGVCAPTLAGIPSAGCPSDATACGARGVCDGLGSCSLGAPAGTPCEVACKGSDFVTTSCDGLGACSVIEASPCAPFACFYTECSPQCDQAHPCGAPAICAFGTCVVPTGGACPPAGPAYCVSEVCQDGVCCESACNGPCESCALPGHEGTCMPTACDVGGAAGSSGQGGSSGSSGQPGGSAGHAGLGGTSGASGQQGGASGLAGHVSGASGQSTGGAAAASGASGSNGVTGSLGALPADGSTEPTGGACAIVVRSGAPLGVSALLALGFVALARRRRSVT